MNSSQILSPSYCCAVVYAKQMNDFSLSKYVDDYIKDPLRDYQVLSKKEQTINGIQTYEVIRG
jgi:hypothetical protein